jgi:hypothetical protein
MERCETCLHWQTDENTNYIGPPYGICGHSKLLDGLGRSRARDLLFYQVLNSGALYSTLVKAIA